VKRLQQPGGAAPKIAGEFRLMGGKEKEKKILSAARVSQQDLRVASGINPTRSHLL
jgi:hypothetical protein